MSGIHISNLEFHYPGPRGFGMRISMLDMASGDRIAIVGPSGSGKTTLLNLVAGTLLPASGEILIGEHCINHLGESARRRFRIDHIGQVFQAFELLDYLTVEENILLSRLIDPSASVDAAARQRAEELLATVGLADKGGERPAKLSHGERQRVAVCRAMLNRPQLILADEPTGNLDQANKQNVVDLLVRQADAHGSTLVMVTHDRSLLGSFQHVVNFNELEGITAAEEGAIA
jgi:putative ABC transport system ATP-binding protein